MNWRDLYASFIASKRMRIHFDETINYEKHHIIPSCFEGIDHPSNYVFLTKKEHMWAHIMLHKAFPESKELFWAIQWFYNFMSSAQAAWYNRHRQTYINMRDYSWSSETTHRSIMADINIKLWQQSSHQQSHAQSRSSAEYRKMQSAITATNWKSGKKKRNPKTESGTFAKIPVEVNGERFASLSEVARRFVINVKTAKHRCLSEAPAFAEWKLIV